MSLCTDAFRTAPMNGGSSALPKTQVYYPQSRPRSYSAGCSSTTNVTKRVSANSPIKVVRVNSARPSYIKTKSVDDSRPSSTVRYKTELCRPFQDYGFCRYGEKCQFAHGESDLRVLPRHPKYKTDLCRTYHTRGFCPYGSRCHFIHNLEEARKASDENLGPPSPTKKTLSLSLSISPSLDSGISSPDDVPCFSGSSVFDFQNIKPTSEFGSSDSDSFSPESNTFSNYFDPLCGPGYSSDTFESQDQASEYDSLSVGSSSPTKRVSDLFDPEPKDVTGMMQGLQLGENNQACPRTSSGHRLPVFNFALPADNDPFAVRRPTY